MRPLTLMKEHRLQAPGALSCAIMKSVRDTDSFLGKRASSDVFQLSGAANARGLFHNSAKTEKAGAISMVVNNLGGIQVDPRLKCPYLHESWSAADYVLAQDRKGDWMPIPPLPTHPTPDYVFPKCFGQFRQGDTWLLIVY